MELAAVRAREPEVVPRTFALCPKSLPKRREMDRGCFLQKGAKDVEREICGRCGGAMAFIRREKLQLGQYGILSGHLSHLCSGALEVSIYCCRACKKLEFYAAGSDSRERPHGVPSRTPAQYRAHPAEPTDPKDVRSAAQGGIPTDQNMPAKASPATSCTVSPQDGNGDSLKSP